MALSDSERSSLVGAGTTPEPVFRRQAVTIALSKSGSDLNEARGLLAKGFANVTQPSFHYIPRGESMASEEDFSTAYADLAASTNNFRDVDRQTLAHALTSNPATLAPLRMILGLTHNELAWTMKQVQPLSKSSGGTLKKFERSHSQSAAAQTEMIETIAATAVAIVDRSVLQIPAPALKNFHSKLDKRDTRGGWQTVAEERGILACAVIDGRGWAERNNALADVVIATHGRTYSLTTLQHLLYIPDIGSLRGTASARRLDGVAER